MNATRAYTTRYFKRLVVGRVQTPTLAMLTERKEKVENFQKEAYYKVSLSDGKMTVTSENILSEKEAADLQKLCNGADAIVTKVKKEQKKISPPKLYDLTSLQREANRFSDTQRRKHWICCRNCMKKNGNVSENRQSVCYRGYERNGRNAYEWDDRVSSIF